MNGSTGGHAGPHSGGHAGPPLLVVVVVMLGVLVACAPEAPNAPDVQQRTAVPTLDVDDPQALCDAVATHWSRDWETTIRALEALEGMEGMEAICPDGLATNRRLYTAYLAYGTQLEGYGREAAAIDAYETALDLQPTGSEAAARLRRLGIYTPQPPERCEAATVREALQAVPDYTPAEGSFARTEGRRSVLEGETYPVYGVNYAPRNTPGQRFLRETEMDVVNAEMDILQGAGLNTLRIFVRYDALFTCPGNGAIPDADNLARLDGIIQTAAEHDFKLIVVLHHGLDGTLYADPPHIAAQTQYLAERYRNEPTILAWDLRDTGDADYERFGRETVLGWLVEMSNAVQTWSPNHLVTASWREDSIATIPAVDFVSVQYFADIEPFRERTALLRDATNKPILLSAVGYSTHEMDETAQRNLLYQVLEAAQINGLAGWLVWKAFDHPLTATCIEPECPGEASADNYYGLWNTSYFPKLSLDAVKAFTGAP